MISYSFNELISNQSSFLEYFLIQCYLKINITKYQVTHV